MPAIIRLESLPIAQKFDQRRAAREEIVLPVVIVVGTTRYNALTLNLSAAGAKIVTSAPFLNDHMKVEFQCGTICAKGTVIWQRGSDFGIRFDIRLSERQLDEQMSRSNALASWREGHPSSGH